MNKSEFNKYIQKAIIKHMKTCKVSMNCNIDQANAIIDIFLDGILLALDVDIDKFALSLKFQFSEDVDSIVQTISKFDNTTIVRAIFSIEYDNPVLNHPELMKQMANKFGFNVIDKLINFGMQFTNNAEDKAMLDYVCNESNNVDAMSLLLGLDIPENAIMM